MHRRTLALAFAVATSLSSPALAQSLTSSPPRTQNDFSRMRVKVGDRLYVTDPDRMVEVSGRLETLSPDEITIDGYRFVPKPGLKIERAGDTVWDGAGLGFLLGGLYGVTVAGPEGCRQHCFLNGGIAFGIVGAIVDGLHEGRTTVFLGAQNSIVARADAGEEAPAPPAPGMRTAFDYGALKLKVGDHVSVMALDGTATTGRVTAMDRETFRVGAVDLGATVPAQIERIGDPIWDGALYGAAFGGMVSLVNESGARACAMRVAAYGSIGVMIDAAVKGRTLLYGGDALGRSVSMRIAPDVGPHHKGVALAVRF